MHSKTHLDKPQVVVTGKKAVTNRTKHNKKQFEIFTTWLHLHNILQLMDL